MVKHCCNQVHTGDPHQKEEQAGTGNCPLKCLELTVKANRQSEVRLEGNKVTFKREIVLALLENSEGGSSLRTGSRALRLMLHRMPSCRLSMRS